MYGGDEDNHGCNIRQDWPCDTLTGTRGPRGVGKMVLRGTRKGKRTRRREDELEGSRHLVHNSLMRLGQSHQFLAEWLRNESVPMGRRRRLMRLVLGNFPCGAWVHDKFDQQKNDRCILCRSYFAQAFRRQVSTLKQTTLSFRCTCRYEDSRRNATQHVELHVETLSKSVGGRRRISVNFDTLSPVTRFLIFCCINHYQPLSIKATHRF